MDGQSVSCTSLGGRASVLTPRIEEHLKTDISCRQHDVIPSNEELIKPITHVALAFMRSDMFMDADRVEWPLFRSVASARQAFSIAGADILVAIGGWGDTGFAVAARNDTSRKMFARNVARMVEATGADGMFSRSPVHLNKIAE